MKPEERKFLDDIWKGGTDCCAISSDASWSDVDAAALTVCDTVGRGTSDSDCVVGPEVILLRVLLKLRFWSSEQSLL